MADVEAGSIIVSVKYKDSEVKAGLAKTKQELEGFDKAGASAGSQFTAGFTKSLKGGNFRKAGEEMADSLVAPMTEQFGALGGMGAEIATSLGPVGVAVAGITAVTVGLEVAANKAAAAWQTGMTNIGKSTNLAKQDLAVLSGELLKFSTTAPISQTELQGLVSRAGSLGVGSTAKTAQEQRAQLMSFTKDAAAMSVAFDMTAADAAQMSAEVSRSFKLPIDEVHHLGSMVTTVGDQLGVPEKKLMDFLNRAAGSSIAVRQGATATAAFGASLMSTGMDAEVAGSMLTMLESQVLSQPKKLEAWAKVLGTSVDGLKGKLKEDLYGTVLKTGDVLGKMDPFEGATKGTEIFGQEIAKYITKANGLGDAYANGLNKGNNAFKEGTRLAEVFGEKGATAEAAWTKFGNAVNVMLVDIGNVTLPGVTQFINDLTTATVAVDEFGKSAYSGFSQWTASTDQWLMDTFGGGAKKVPPAALDMSKMVGDTYEDYVADGVSKGLLDGTNSGLDAAASSVSGLYEDMVKRGVNAGMAFLRSSGVVSDEAAIKLLNDLEDRNIPGMSWNDRSFDYLGKKFIYSLGEGGSTEIQQLYVDGVKAGSNEVQHGLLNTNVIADPVTFFEKALGLPAPKEGSAEYFRLLGDEVSAQKKELQDKLAEANPLEWDLESVQKTLSEIGSAFSAQSYQNQYNYLNKGPLSSDTVSAYKSFGDIMKEGVSISGVTRLYALSKNMQPGTVWGPQMLQDYENYGEDIISHISDGMSFAEDQVASVGEELASVFGDSFLDREEEEGLKAKRDFLQWFKDVAAPKLDIDVDKSGINKAIVDLDKAINEHKFTANINTKFNDVELTFQKFLYEHKDLWVGAQDKGFPIQEAGARQVYDRLTELQRTSETGTEEQQAQAKYEIGLWNDFEAAVEKGDVESLGVANASLDALQTMGSPLASMVAVAQLSNMYLANIATDIKNLKGPYYSDQEYAKRSGYSALYSLAYGNLPYTGQISSQSVGPYLKNYLRDQGLFFQGGGLTGNYEGIAYVHPNEAIIPVAEIPGLYGKSNNAPKGSMQYWSGDRWFEDYPVKVTPPVSYRWSQYPAAPNVAVRGNVPQSWLSDEQKSGMEWISSEVRALQLQSIGKSQVLPWFARGYQDQPKWWSDYATALSPKYESVWTAKKGGEVPKIGPDDLANAKNQYIYDPREDACIQVSEGAGAGLVTNDSFWLKRGATSSGDDQLSQINDNIETSNDRLGVIEANTGKSSRTLDTIGASSFSPYGLTGKASGLSPVATSSNLVVGIDPSTGEFMKYDPRTDTCEGLGFNAPPPNLVTSDRFLLGLSADSPAWKSVEEGGWGGQVATPATQDLLDEQNAARKAAEETAKNTKETAKNTQQIYAGVSNLVAGGVAGGGSRLAGWGNPTIGGSYGSAYGDWYTGGTAGLSSMFGTAPAASWMNEAAREIGGASAMQFAEGGSFLVDQPTLFKLPGGRFGVAGEAGEEIIAILPKNNPSRMRDILADIVPMIGAKPFADGGIIGGHTWSRYGDTPSSSVPNVTIENININGSGLSQSQLKIAIREAIAEEVPKAWDKARRRGS